MGKRSSFERVERDYYPTPYNAVKPLLPHLPKTFSFVEPCAGDARLIHHLSNHGGKCIHASDIEPKDDSVIEMNCFNVKTSADYIITNPPWDRKILHPMIEHFSDIAPTWFLFDADWMHTVQSKNYLTRIRKIVSIGRVKWIDNSKSTGKDNCCWYLFDKDNNSTINFYGRC